MWASRHLPPSAWGQPTARAGWLSCQGGGRKHALACPWNNLPTSLSVAHWQLTVEPWLSVKVLPREEVDRDRGLGGLGAGARALGWVAGPLTGEGAGWAAGLVAVG